MKIVVVGDGHGVKIVVGDGRVLTADGPRQGCSFFVRGIKRGDLVVPGMFRVVDLVLFRVVPDPLRVRLAEGINTERHNLVFECRVTRGLG